MTGNKAEGQPRSLVDRITPRAGVRPQLFSAAIVWAVGGAILVVRGIYYVHDRSWHSWLLGIGMALLIAVPKSRYIMNRVARKAVARILHRDHACYFGFFSWKSWLFVLLMMGGGMILRRTVVNPGEFGAGIMGAIYLGIGSALLFSDRIYWTAAIKSLRESLAEVEQELEAAESGQHAGTVGETSGMGDQ